MNLLKLLKCHKTFAYTTLVNPARLMFGMSDAYAELLQAAMQGLPAGRAHLNRAALRLRGVPETCVDAWENVPDTLEALNDISSAVSLEKMATRLARRRS